MSKNKSKPVSVQTAVKPPVIYDECCEWCDHFDGALCRRNPPVVFLTPSGTPRSVWPPVELHDTCGEWKKSQGLG